ncbi:Phosphatidylinositol 4-kinase type 2-beta [Phytophthora boehmeriae]|uniref:Phosphatidylinositol 4-kinase type 2-beta n=1 Tax=Phytophthora boehmeriae TaxID=109152 RepID=A0A8T1WIC8_9STRA|nr:Phosphatidylinositol 4-kinase type 2-beta [Phytophthora boehmeriae]
MQSISVSAVRSPTVKAHQSTRVVSSSKATLSASPPPAVPIIAKPLKPLQLATQGRNVAKVLTDGVPSLQPTVDSKTQPAISIEVLKPGAGNGGSVYAEEISLLASQVQSGLQARVAPIPIEDCTGGVYYLRTKNRRLTAVFKPADEEPYALNNPKNFQKPEQAAGASGIRQGISPQDSAVREVAAYLLDHQHFAKVPTTMLASLYHPAFHYDGSESLHQRLTFKLSQC